MSHYFYRKKTGSYDRFRGWFGIPDAVVESLVFAVAGTPLMLAYIGMFGRYFYSSIPEQIGGGGRPRLTKLLIASDAIPAVRELAFEVAEEAPLLAPIQPPWESEQTLIVRLPPPRERTVVQLARGLVDGIVTGAAIAPPASPEPGGASP